jgi:hypothetical protein
MDRIKLEASGSWLSIDLELNVPPDADLGRDASVKASLTEELLAVAGTLELVAAIVRGRTARRARPELRRVDEGTLDYVLRYLRETRPDHHAGGIVVRPPAGDVVREFGEALRRREGRTEAASSEEAKPKDDEAVAEDLELDAIDEAVDEGLVDEPEQVDAAEPSIDPPDAGDVEAACRRLNPVERLHPGPPLARELGIPGNRVGPYVRMARARSWLPMKVDGAGAEVLEDVSA